MAKLEGRKLAVQIISYSLKAFRGVTNEQFCRFTAAQFIRKLLLAPKNRRRFSHHLLPKLTTENLLRVKGSEYTNKMLPKLITSLSGGIISMAMIVRKLLDLRDNIKYI